MSAVIARAFALLFVEPWQRINREAAEERALHPGFDVQAVVVLCVAALVLWFEWFYGDRPNFEAAFARLRGSRYFGLEAFGWWATAKLLGFVVVPIVTIKLLGGRLADFGLGWKKSARHLWIYVVLFLAVLPVVVVASYTRPFLHTYPFYRLAGRSWFDFFAWELMYGCSFFGLELFFRGFLLFGLKRSMGAYAIFVMVVPYCMIHFIKPPAEALGAIFAGIVLGTLAMATRSIWCGVLIHLSVAWTMDLLALAHKSGFPR